MYASRPLRPSIRYLGLSSRPLPIGINAARSTSAKRPASHFQHAHLSSTHARPQQQAKNRVYSPIRSADELTIYLSLSSTSRRPLITLWTTSWCTTCQEVSPLVKSLIEDAGVGEAEGGVTYAEVEYDAPDVVSAGLGFTYMIKSVPTLLSFDAGEAQVATKVEDGKVLRNKQFVEDWIRTEARRHGGR